MFETNTVSSYKRRVWHSKCTIEVVECQGLVTVKSSLQHGSLLFAAQVTSPMNGQYGNNMNLTDDCNRPEPTFIRYKQRVAMCCSVSLTGLDYYFSCNIS